MTPLAQGLDVVLRPDPSEEAAVAAVRDQLDRAFGVSGYQPCLIGPEGEHVEIPASVFAALTEVVRGMAAGQTMTLMPSGRQLTTQQAAEMLHMSRPHLVKLLDRGEIPFERVGTHRRLRADDVLRYRAERAKRREKQLDELAQLSQDIEEGYR